jgi:pSer/pThr/pTyr-binding forkhead associated (FHA) protein
MGRRLNNHLVIDDLRVSRLHAQIRVIQNQYYLFDLNSTGGTFVNDERISRALLYPGDKISLAGYEFTFVIESGRLQEEADDFTAPSKAVKEKNKTKPKKRVSG